MYKYWSFIQKTLIESRLAEKYQALVSKALLSNHAPDAAADFMAPYQNGVNTPSDLPAMLSLAASYEILPSLRASVEYLSLIHIYLLQQYHGSDMHFE